MFCVGRGTRRVGITLAALGVWIVLADWANASLVYTTGQTQDSGNYLVISGDFEQSDDLSRFLAVVQTDHPRAVFFNSPGGNVLKAMELGRLIRSQHLATIQMRSTECASACALAFMGGLPRLADPGSIGVHKTSFADTSGMNVADAVSVVQKLTAEVIAYMTEMGVDPGLLQLSLIYDSNDIRYLSGSEMERYHLTFNGPKTTDDTTGSTNLPAPIMPTPAPTAVPAPAVASLPPASESPPVLSIPVARTGRVQHYKGIAPLKAAATMASQTQENFANGSPVMILDDTGKWYQVRVGSRVGYMYRAWIWVDQFEAAPYGRQFIQVKSFDNLPETEQFVRKSPVPLTAYLATNGWFAITLDRTFDPDTAQSLVTNLKGSGSIPDDSVATFGNAFVRKVCCSSQR